MLFDDDWCGCKEPSCLQQWRLDLNKGWIPIDVSGNPQREVWKNKPKVKATFAGKSFRTGKPRPKVR